MGNVMVKMKSEEIRRRKAERSTQVREHGWSWRRCVALRCVALGRKEKLTLLSSSTINKPR